MTVGIGLANMYVDQEKLCLKWNDFQENAISAFGTLREDRELADVTLACENGQQLEAHKVILASSSPFFLNLLRRNKHPHPLIYMRGLKSEDLVAIIDFLYFGEANVDQENLDSFLAVAEELQLKGLMGAGADREAEEMNTPTIQKNDPRPVQKATSPKHEVPSPDISSSFKTEEASPFLEETDYTVAADLQVLDDKIKSMIISSENRTTANKKMAICKVCGKEDKFSHIKSHIEAKHITGVSHICNICGTAIRSRPALAMHKRSKHTESK